MTSTAEYSSLVLKGTRHGLLASIREDSDWSVIISELNSLSANGEGFLTDASLTFDFGWREITEEQFDQIIGSLNAQNLTCNGILSTSLNTRTIAEERGYRAIIGRLGLAKHHGRRLRREQEQPEEIKVAELPDTVIQPQREQSSESLMQAPELPSGEPIAKAIEAAAPVQTPQPEAKETTANVPPRPEAKEERAPTPEQGSSSPSQEGIHVPRYQDEEPTLYLRKTLRGGQKVVFAGNVVLLGDLNPGAQIEADGDIIVMGQLRGTVHAGADGDKESTVITSSLRATQLRIADHFWDGDKKNTFFKKSTLNGTLKARLDGDSVVVEALPVR